MTTQCEVYWGPGTTHWSRDWELETYGLLVAYETLSHVHRMPVDFRVTTIFHLWRPPNIPPLAWKQQQWIRVYNALTKVCWETKTYNSLHRLCYNTGMPSLTESQRAPNMPDSIAEAPSPLVCRRGRLGVWRPERAVLVDSVSQFQLP